MIENISNITAPFIANISTKIITSDQAYYKCLFQDSNQFIFFILLFAIYSYLIFEIINSIYQQKLDYKIYTEFLFGFFIAIFFALQTSFFDLFCILNFVIIICLIVVNYLIKKYK